LGVLAPWGASSGDWAHLSPQEIYDQSDLVVWGEYVGSENVQLPTQAVPVNLGVVRVDSVVKGEKLERLRLALPPVRPGGLISDNDVFFEKGQRGLWYLKRRSDGVYLADRPDRFVPVEIGEQQLKTLRLK
jgi:hypothetical protein